MLQLKRTDSTTILSYKKKICVVMSNLKMAEKIKIIDDDLKKSYKKYSIKNE